jgi:putative transposase
MTAVDRCKPFIGRVAYDRFGRNRPFAHAEADDWQPPALGHAIDRSDVSDLPPSERSKTFVILDQEGDMKCHSRRTKPEEIIGKLRETEIVLAQGGSVAEACRRIAVSEQTYYRWRKEYGGLKTDQARRTKDLEKENGRLRRAISDLTLDKLVLQEAARGNF